MKFFGGIIEISTISETTYPGDTSGDSMVATLSGSASRSETAQVYSQPGFIGKAHQGQKGIRLRIGSVDIIIGTINYNVSNPTNYGETKVYSTDADGEEKAGMNMYNDGLVAISNESQDMAALMSDLIDLIKGITTTGSASAQAIDAATQLLLDDWLIQAEQLFTETK